MKKETLDKFKKALKIIKGSEKILVVGHRNPDGDALSSICAISLILNELNKTYYLFSYDEPEDNFSFLPEFEKIKSERKKVKNNFDQFDLIIILDCGEIKRSGLFNEIKAKSDKQYTLEFDHHPSDEKISNLELRFPNMNSTTEVIYHFLKINSLKLDKKIAECILTGILTDTANFLHPLTNYQTLEIASQMLNKGANYPKITKKTWQNKSISSMKLWSLVLNNLNINQKYNVAFSVLTKEEVKEFKEDLESLDSILHLITNLKDIKALILIKEDESGRIKGNLRTNHDKIDVSKLANHLGGGGHAKASGFIIEGNIEKNNFTWRIN
ncbi:bifunctional oligoribonuclease/PAP phosphatase NrnA [bacterium]|nr:bifunctional oligoribonuclease/PAP phosphatase NrnA [bacterium]